MGKEYLACFDLDGTLFDTKEVNYFSYRDALLTYGIVLDREYFVTKCNGRHYTEFLPIIMGNAEEIDSVHTQKKIAYQKNLDKARINSHLIRMIKLMKESYNTAIVTTASRKNTVDILKYFGCEDLFDLLITQEDVAEIKPSPEGYIKAMNYFGIDSTHTIIFEDSEVGVQAARYSGAAVMVIDIF